MKKIVLLLAILLIPLTSLSNYYEKHRYEKSRTHERQFPVSANPTFNLTGKYSNVIIVEWDRSEISVTALVTASSNNEALTQGLLDRIIVDMSKSGNAVTVYNELKSISNSDSKQFYNTSFHIVYTVKVPRKTRMNLINKYGNVSLPEITAPLSLELKYGNLKILDEIKAASSLNVKYGNISIGDASDQLTVDLKYGNMSAQNVAAVYMTSSYCIMKFNTLKLLNGYTKYDTYKINKAGSISLSNSSYGSYTIGHLEQSLELLGFRYSNIKVESVALGFKAISIPDAGYSDIKIGIPNPSFSADLIIRYGNIRLYESKSDGKLQTTYGNNTSSRVDISNKYGNILIWK